MPETHIRMRNHRTTECDPKEIYGTRVLLSLIHAMNGPHTSCQCVEDRARPPLLDLVKRWRPRRLAVHVCDGLRELLRLITEATFNRHATLVLSARVEHCEHLARQLCEDDVAAAALTSRTPKSQRAAILEAFRGGELAAVCATSLADEGLDVSRLERLILASASCANMGTRPTNRRRRW